MAASVWQACNWQLHWKTEIRFKLGPPDLLVLSLVIQLRFDFYIFDLGMLALNNCPILLRYLLQIAVSLTSKGHLDDSCSPSLLGKWYHIKFWLYLLDSLEPWRLWYDRPIFAIFCVLSVDLCLWCITRKRNFAMIKSQNLLFQY